MDSWRCAVKAAPHMPSPGPRAPVRRSTEFGRPRVMDRAVPLRSRYGPRASCRVSSDETTEGTMMTKLVGALLTIWIGTLALADTQAPMSRAAAEGERTTETLEQLELDWVDAERAGDSDQLEQLVADDWTGIN